MSNKILVLTPTLQRFNLWCDEILQAYEAIDLFQDVGEIDFNYKYPQAEYVAITETDQLRGLNDVVGAVLLPGHEKLDIDYNYLEILCKRDLWVLSIHSIKSTIL